MRMRAKIIHSTKTGSRALSWENSVAANYKRDRKTHTHKRTQTYIPTYIHKYARSTHLFENAFSEVTLILFFSLVMVTVSPNTPAFPATLMRSCKNFSKEVMSMILSSTGFPQSMVKVCAFFFPLVPPAGFFATTAGAIRRITKTKFSSPWDENQRKETQQRKRGRRKETRENEGRL